MVKLSVNREDLKIIWDEKEGRENFEKKHREVVSVSKRLIFSLIDVYHEDPQDKTLAAILWCSPWETKKWYEYGDIETILRRIWKILYPGQQDVKKPNLKNILDWLGVSENVEQLLKVAQKQGRKYT